MKKYLFYIIFFSAATAAAAAAATEEGCIKKEAFGRCVSFGELIVKSKVEAFSQVPSLMIDIFSNIGKEITQNKPTPVTTITPVQKIKKSSIVWSTKKSTEKKYTPKPECNDQNLEWEKFVKCTNERMDATAKK
jgi:hypothetical protein